MARTLGERSVKQAGLASFFGFVSSSCSFAALAASRSVLVKGAHPANALAFLISSTNLVLELGTVLRVLLSGLPRRRCTRVRQIGRPSGREGGGTHGRNP